MKAEYKFDKTKPLLLESLFETYGYRNKQVIYREPEGVRFRIPADVKDMQQTGIYSHFALAGDCEVTCNYQVISVEAPETGYGCGIGIAFELPFNGGVAQFQRVVKPKEGDRFVFSTEIKETKGSKEKMPEIYQTAKASGKWGQLVMRRVKKEVIFLAKEEEAEEFQEIGKLPFTDRTIRQVRFFVDAGGSPTAVDMRISQLEVRAEELTGGIPQLQPVKRNWWWLLAGVPVVLAALYFAFRWISPGGAKS